MRGRMVILMLTTHVHALALASGSDPVISPNWAQESAPERPRADRAREEAIREAVREAVSEDLRTRDYRDTRTDAYGSEGSEKFGRDFEEARVPGCLRPDGLKRQPTGWGPFQLAGLLAAPFILVAKVRGKCN